MHTPDTALSALAPYRSDFPTELAAIDEHLRDASARRARLAHEQAPLSIGVIGQIKAGKSSFLNQLLFAGRPLLPEAATPKTAALTRLHYAPSARFCAHFYSSADWAQLERLADSQGADLMAEVARQLVEQARTRLGSALPGLLAQGQAVLQVDDWQQLLERINDYVGDNGRYTGLVEHTELGLPLPELRGIEIVDTPGLNDPIASRTDKTRRYMAQCDVVLMLSRSSQLLDATDQDLLAAQLPAKGVKRLLLLASQFDGALLDDGDKHSSLHACETRLRQRLGEYAQRNLDKLAALRAQQGQSDVAALLRGIGAPLFCSTFAQAYASQPPAQWSKQQQHTHEQIGFMAADHWGGHGPSNADWARIGGFAPLHGAVAQARADKDQILATQRARLDTELARNQAQVLAQLRERAQQRIDFLRTHEMADLDAHQRQSEQRLHAIAQALVCYVQAQAQAARQQAQRIETEWQQGAMRARQLDDRTGYETHTHSVRVSDSTWYKPWTWGTSHLEYYSETRSYRYLAVADALENLRLYLEQAQRQLLQLFDALIAPAALSAGLRRELLRVLDTRSDDFDPRALRSLIEGRLNSLPWPKLDLQTPDPAAALSGFGSELRSSSDKAALRTQLDAAVQQLLHTLTQHLRQAVEGVCTQLDALAAQLHDALTAALTADVERLRAALADKAAQLQHLQQLMHTLEQLGCHATSPSQAESRA